MKPSEVYYGKINWNLTEEEKEVISKYLYTRLKAAKAKKRYLVREENMDNDENIADCEKAILLNQNLLKELEEISV